MKLRQKIQEAFTFKSELPELENIYIPTRTVDTNKGASFNERAEGMMETKKERLNKLT